MTDHPHPEDVARIEMLRACRVELGRLVVELEANHLTCGMGELAEALRKATQLRLWIHEIVRG